MRVSYRSETLLSLHQATSSLLEDLTEVSEYGGKAMSKQLQETKPKETPRRS